MGIIAACIRNPAGVAVMVAILVILGGLSLRDLPVQLFPEIERPRLSIMTFWRAASPSEIEAEIVEPQEDVLRGLPGMVMMEANAQANMSQIQLEFTLETDMNTVALEVLNRLNRLPPLPDDADPPQLQFGAGGGGGDSNQTLIFYFLQRLADNPRPLVEYRRFLRDTLIPRIESVPGVSGVSVESGRVDNDEVQIVFDPFLAAQYGIDIPSVARTVGRADDVSGGQVDVGRRQYTLQFEGRFDPETLSDQVLEWRDGEPIRLGDIATVSVAPAPRTTFAYQNGNEAIGLRIMRENNANVLATIDGVNSLFDELRDTVLAEQGLDAQKSFDPSVFILRAISLLTNNLLIGITLAVGVLWLFLRRPRATLLIASTIPICLLTTFLILDLAGRSINVISLAGLAFATGMVLDAAIVVLENIVRLREQGKDVAQASQQGAMEVAGALLASTATTIAIFVPIIFIRDVEGQLFADLALTIAIAVGMSLIVAVFVLPTAARYFVRQREEVDNPRPLWESLAGGLMALTDTPRRRMAWIAGLITLPIVATLLMIPSLNYLPPVKRDAVDTWLNVPDGVSVDFVDQEVAQPILKRLDPYLKGEKEPALRNYYVIFWGQGGSIGVRVQDQSKVDDLLTLMREEILVDLPDVQTFSQQGSLFGGFDDGTGLVLHLQGEDIGPLAEAAIEARRLLTEALPQGTNVRIFPNPDPAEPELRIRPRDDRILEAQLTRPDLAQIIRSLGDGLFLGEYFDGESRLNIILRSETWNDPDALGAVPIATPSGAVVPLGELVEIERTVGPSSIRRVDKRRTVSLFVGQPPGLALQDMIDTFEQEVQPQLADLLPPGGAIQYGGNANDLNRAVSAMAENFLLAIGLLFLLMAALFKSLRDSALVVIALPLATVGGMGGLQVLNLFVNQPLDLLTMIGFIILLGLVVNNAILLVDRTRRSEAAGASRKGAVRDALRMRLRPIFMSTLTSLFGMLPLVMIPGIGSTIYRGLAVTIVGGMAVSLIFTLLLLPSLLRLGEARRPGIVAT